MPDTKHTVICGDSRQMAALPGHSVHLIVTSPPYWQLKDYGSEQQIGFDDDYETYINHLNLVWNECYRVLHPGCRLCINIGDQFARSVYYGRYKVIPIRTEIIRFCETIGFDYMGAVIWQKVATTNTTGGAPIMGSYPYPRNGFLKIDYEFILLFKKQGKAPKPSKEVKEKSQLTIEEWNAYFSGHWNFPGVRQDGHLAMFPEELPKRLIKMFSFVGDTVLDPFLGSGTTSLAAKNLGRNSVGYEINKQFLPIIKDKMQDIGDLHIVSEKNAKTAKDYSQDIKALPYIFEDPLKMDKKVDVKKRQFGSRIDGNGNIGTVEYFSVKEVINPTTIRLHDGSTVCLAGILTDVGRQGKACDFLSKMINGKKVFLKYCFDKNERGQAANAYVYLKNKTFVNAHLIKSGLVLLDSTLDHPYREKFKKLYDQAAKEKG